MLKRYQKLELKINTYRLAQLLELLECSDMTMNQYIEYMIEKQAYDFNVTKEDVRRKLEDMNREGSKYEKVKEVNNVW